MFGGMTRHRNQTARTQSFAPARRILDMATTEKRHSDPQGLIDVSQEAIDSLSALMKDNPGKLARLRIAGFG